MHESGVSALQIGKMMGKDHTTILHHLWQMGFDRRKEKMTERIARIKFQKSILAEKQSMLDDLQRERKELEEMTEQRKSEWKLHLERVAQAKVKAWEMYELDIPIKEIAKELGTGSQNAMGYIRAHPLYHKSKRRIFRDILQVDGAGKVVGRFPSLASAAKATKVNYSTISRCLKGQDLTAGGFRWVRE